MTVSIRLGDCAWYSKVRNLDKPNNPCYEDLKIVDSTQLTRQLLEEYPYEFFTGTKTKLFADYDEKSDDLDYVKTKRKVIRDSLREHSGDYTNGYVFTESTANPNKVSFHIIFKKINIIRSEFIKEDEQELFCKLVGKENFEHIDHQVYGHKTCFRLPFGTVGYAGRSDKKFPHIPYSDFSVLNLSDYVLSVPDDSITKIYASQIGRAMHKQLAEDARNYRDDSEDRVEYNGKLRKAMELVNLERFKQGNQWRALLVLMKTNNLGRDNFVRMSEQSGYPSFDESACIKAWRDCKENDSFGLSLVIGWLKQDGIDIKKIFPVKSPLLQDLLNGWFKQGEFTDFNVATALKTYYGDNLIFTSQGWFHYKNEWKLGDKNIVFHPIMKLLSDDLLAYIESENEKFNKKMETLEDASDKDLEVAKAKGRLKLKQAINKLQSASKIKSVLEVSEGIFLDDNALQTFDQKPEWFCFKNQKAWHLKTKEIIQIKATDRVLTTCGYDLPERNQDDIDLVMALVESISPNIKSLLSALSQFLYGININELFIIFKGEGRNGKGLLISLLEIMMGLYYYSLPTEVLTEQSKGAGRAIPELAQARWSRCLMASEPDEQKMMVRTTLNILTGRDPINVRELYKNSSTFTPFFTLGLMCNVAPNVSGGINDAIKDRMVIQIFPYKFVDEPTEAHHRQKDNLLKSKIKDNVAYRNGLLFILMETWYENQGKYISCDDSKEEEGSYAKNNNPLSHFLEGYSSSETFIKIKDVLKHHNDNYEFLSAQKFKIFLEQAGVRVRIDNKHGHGVYLSRN